MCDFFLSLLPQLNNFCGSLPRMERRSKATERNAGNLAPPVQAAVAATEKNRPLRNSWDSE